MYIYFLFVKNQSYIGDLTLVVISYEIWREEKNMCSRFCLTCYTALIYHKLSLVVRKPTFWFLTWSDTNQAVQLQKMARGLKFRI